MPGLASFTRRFLGALSVSAATFEDVEADAGAGAQAALVVAMSCAAAGLAIASLTRVSLATFIAGCVLAVGGWVVWIAFITLVGTRLLPEARTDSNLGEVFRTFGFAAAPGTLLAFAAIGPVAGFVLVITSVWMIATAAIAARQALDFRSTMRAIAVCVVAWLAVFGTIAVIQMMLMREVQ